MKKNEWYELIDKKQKVVMWGTGMLAEKYAPFLKESGIELYAVCDNKQQKWGECYFGVKVLSPNQLHEICKTQDIILVIATTYYKEIMEQVKDFGFFSIYDLGELEKAECLWKVASENNFFPKEVFECAKCSSKIQDLLEDVDKRTSLIEKYLEEEFEQFRKKYNLSICAIIKNEGEYLLEWIEYHRMVGVEHFYIYDNESTDDMYERIKRYIEEGIVTYKMWLGEVQQLPVYHDAIEKYKYESKYIAFIDGDEFLVPIKGDSIYEIVEEIFTEHLNVGGVGVNWRNYGSSFWENKPEGLLFENYKYRAEDFEFVNRHIKTICNPRRALRFVDNPHSMEYSGDYVCISENGSFIPGPFFYDGIGRKLRINHYKKTLGEFKARLLAGQPDAKRVFTEEILHKYEQEALTWNAVYDPIMDSYIEELKQRLLKYRNAKK